MKNVITSWLINPIMSAVIAVILTIISGILIFLTFALTGIFITFDPAIIVLSSLITSYIVKFQYGWSEVKKYTVMTHMLLWLTLTPRIFFMLESQRSVYIVAMSAIIYPFLFLTFSDLKHKYFTNMDKEPEVIGFRDSMSY